MQYRRLGCSDLNISAVSLGTWAFGESSYWGKQNEDDAIETIRAAIECGINFFDTAELYCTGDAHAENVLGRGIRGVRDKVILASKVGYMHLTAEDVRVACESTLRRLQTDHIDVYYIHMPNRAVPIEQTLGAMEQLKAEGKIRVIGCSNFGKQDLTEALQHSRVEVDQLCYSLLFRAIEYEILPTCIQNKVSVIAYSPLAQGLLTGEFRSACDVPPSLRVTRFYSGKDARVAHGDTGAEWQTFAAIEKIRDICLKADLPMAQAAVAWELRQPGIDGVIVGARRPDEIRMAAEAVSLAVPDDVVEELDHATQNLREALGPNADVWFKESRVR